MAWDANMIASVSAGSVTRPEDPYGASARRKNQSGIGESSTGALTCDYEEESKIEKEPVMRHNPKTEKLEQVPDGSLIEKGILELERKLFPNRFQTSSVDVKSDSNETAAPSDGTSSVKEKR